VERSIYHTTDGRDAAVEGLFTDGRGTREERDLEGVRIKWNFTRPRHETCNRAGPGGIGTFGNHGRKKELNM